MTLLTKLALSNYTSGVQKIVTVSQDGVKVLLLPCVQGHVSPRDRRDKGALVDTMPLVQPTSALVLKGAMCVSISTENSQPIASVGTIANVQLDGVKEVILAVVGDADQRKLMVTSVTGQIIILVQVESAGGVTTAQIHMVSCLIITTVAQIPNATLVSIAIVVPVTGDLVGRDIVGEKSLMGTDTEGQMLLANLVVKIVIFVDVTMLKEW